MSQDRKIIFGDLVESADIPTCLANIASPGRLRGMDFSVGGAAILNISAGSCLLPDGVLILEDQARELVVSNSAFPTDYTVVYQLEDARVIGGSPALLRLLPGLIRQENLTDACVLGWIRYPGGSVPLPATAFVQPHPLRIESRRGVLFKEYLPPFPDAIRAPEERPGGVLVRENREANLSSSFSRRVSFGGVPTRLLGATVTTDSVSIPGSLADYDSFSVKRLFVVNVMTTTGSNLLTNVSDTTRITIGQFLSGAGIPSNATVTAVSGTTVTMNQNATLTTPPTQTVPINVTETLYSYSSRTTAQGTITAAVPASFVRTPSLPTEKFILGASDLIQIDGSTTGSPPAAAGEINVLMEAPASSGNWQERVVLFDSEQALQITNISLTTRTYDFKLPFVISGAGQPRKLISRLNVDLNCIVTFRIRVGSDVLTLNPVGGGVADVGQLSTREFSLPLGTVDWIPGTTASIEISVQAQPGKSASFSYVALSLDDTPFLVFL